MSVFADYIDWRAEHPSDDLMTDLLQAEFEDVDGEIRTLTKEQVLGYIGLLASAGNETTNRLISWTGKVLADHPDQRRELLDDRSLIPNAIEEMLRFEPPSPVQARYVTEDGASTTATWCPRAASCSCSPHRRTATSAGSRMATASTSTARSTIT